MSEMRSNGHSVVHIDGDAIRKIFALDDLNKDYSYESRMKNADRAVELCKFLSDQGFNVVCSLLSISNSHRRSVRNYCSNYLEVFLDVPIQTLIERDPKGIYRAAMEKDIPQIVGIDIDFEKPESPDFTFRNDFDLNTLRKNVQQLMNLIKS